MTDTKPGSRRSRGAVGRVAKVRRLSIVHCHGRRDWRVGILAAFVALAGTMLAGTMEVAVAQGTAGASMGSTAETVESLLRAAFEKSGVRAAAWCLVKDGRVISQTGFGFADSAKARRANAESTIFRAASNGKVFVALSALLVEAEGRLDLRADVNSILKRVRLPENFDAPVTLDHLLTHTGGFEDRFLGGLAASPDLVAMPGVAYGFFEGMANGHRTLHHNGDGGSHSLIWLMPDVNAGLFVVYTEPVGVDPAEPRERAAAAVADWLVPARPFTLSAPPPDFAARAARFVGIYRPTQLSVTTLEKLAALPAQISVTDRRDGTLGLALGLGSESEVFVETAPLLFRSASGVYVAFSEGVDGRIIGLTGTAGTVDDPLSAIRVRWLDDSRLHLGLIAAALVVVAVRLLVMIGGLVARGLRRVAHRQVARTPPGLAPDGWGWWLSGIYALLCIAAPLVSAISIVSAGGPMFQLPNGVYVGLMLLTLVALAGVILVPLAVRAWARREGTGWHRVLLTAVAFAGVGTAPFLYYWNLLGFNA